MKTKKQIIAVLSLLALFINTGSVYTSSVTAATKTTTPEISQEKDAQMDKQLSLGMEYANKVLENISQSNYSEIVKNTSSALKIFIAVENDKDYIQALNPTDKKTLFENLNYMKGVMYFERARAQIENTGNISQGISDLNKALEANSASVAPYLLDCAETAMSNNNKTLANIFT